MPAQCGSEKMDMKINQPYCRCCSTLFQQLSPTHGYSLVDTSFFFLSFLLGVVGVGLILTPGWQRKVPADTGIHTYGVKSSQWKAKCVLSGRASHQGSLFQEDINVDIILLSSTSDLCYSLWPWPTLWHPACSGQWISFCLPTSSDWSDCLDSGRWEKRQFSIKITHPKKKKKK